VTANSRLLAAAAAAALGILLTVPAGATGPDAAGPQVSGEQVVDVPPTPSCTVTLAKDVSFRNTAYSSGQGAAPDVPFYGSYRPTCGRGPWAKVIVTLKASVDGGTQFDRIGDVMVNGIELLHFTTPEGEDGVTTWTSTRDVTPESAGLGVPGPSYVQIGNQTDSTYTGVFHASAFLTFYKATRSHPAPRPAHQVIGLVPRGVNDTASITKPKDRLGSTVVLPVNTTNLTAQVFTSGHGSCEEDWWGGSAVANGLGYRDIALYVDGRVAGFAPVFPTLFTGGWGPDNWRPIVSPRTIDLRPYVLDLTAFVPLLTDGRPHSFALGMGGFAQSCTNDHWYAAANLLVHTNPLSRARTTGTMTTYTADGLVMDDPSGQGLQGTAAHHLRVVSTVHPARMPAAVVTTTDSSDATIAAAAAAVNSAWTWVTGTTVSTGGHSYTATSTATYGFRRAGQVWTFQDDWHRVLGKDAVAGYEAQVVQAMRSVGVFNLGVDGAASDSWQYADSHVGCVDHELDSTTTLTDTTSPACGHGVTAPARRAWDTDRDGVQDVDELSLFPYS
jgi:hypothetical protein